MSRMAACTARAARRRQHLIALGMLQPNADDQSGAMSSGHVGTAVKAKHRSLLRAKVGMSGVAIPAAFAAEEGPSGQPRMQAVDEPAGLPGPANSQTDAIAVGNNYAGISVSSSNSMGLLPQFACVDDFMDLLPLSTLPDLVEAYTVD